MEQWKQLEFDYAQRLRESSPAERRALYSEAYTNVFRHRQFPSDKPEDRTAGTSPALVELLAQMVTLQESVLEVGCGRGYTCLMLAPHVASIVGTDVSETALNEAKEVLAQYQRTNAEIRNVSALDLLANFAPEQFTTAISIEVVEHLHPEDAAEHFAQVFGLLMPGGRYIIVMPNRLNGPHDITRDEFPNHKEAMGFHLNETTYREITTSLHKVGFVKFHSFYPYRSRSGERKVLYLPYQVNLVSEFLYRLWPKAFSFSPIESLIDIRLAAYKP